MKENTMHEKFRIALLLTMIALVVTLSMPAEAVVTKFRLKVNDRSGRKAARVLFTLELSGAPAGTIKVGNAVEHAIPDSFVEDGDKFIAIAGIGNSIRVEYTALSLFAAVGMPPAPNFCNPIAGGKEVILTFSGPSVNAFRINTYTALPAGLEGDCGTARLRVSTNASALDSFTADGTPSTPLDKGRHPLDVVLVLDESGSMSSRAPGAPMGSPSKWSILTDAVTHFVNKWAEIDAKKPSGAEWAGDRIGLVFFTTGVTAHAFAAGAGTEGLDNFYRTRGTVDAGPGYNWAKVIDAMSLHGPSSSTALGKGINMAIDKWNRPGESALTINDPTFIVMTDGIQNVGPMIATKMGTTIQQLQPSGGGAEKELHSYYIPMQTIAFGTPATTEADLLSRVADQTAGVTRLSPDLFATYDAFADALVAMLKGGTVSLSRRVRGTLTGASSTPISINIDGSVDRAVFSVEWERGQSRGLDLVVTPPPATPPGPTHSVESATSVVQRFDIPGAGGPGTWTVSVARKPGTGTQPIPYNLSILLLEGRLAYQVSFNKLDIGTGDDLGVRAVISYDGQPLSGLAAGAIQARIRRPGEALGTILHNSLIDIPGQTAGAADPGSRYNRKVDALNAGGALLPRIEPADVTTITLTDRGNGVYEGTFPNTTVPGKYHADVTLDWNDPRTGAIGRFERLEREIKVNADASNSEIRVNPGSTPGTFLISVTPRDRFGNYVGPGKAEVVIPTVNGGGTITGAPVDANETGTYVFTIANVPPGQTPNVDFTVDAEPIGGTKGGGGRNRFFIDVGPNFPHGAFGNGVDGKGSINVGLERLLPNNWSVEGILGYHAFDSAFVSNPRIWQLSIGGKRYFGTAPWHPFIDASVGAYRFDPGNTTKFGANAGAGVLYDFRSTWGIEGVYQYHSINVSGATDRFSTVQLGLRVRF
jgi:opacity protein-like surface antigen